jgi:hypothetical protein
MSKNTPWGVTVNEPSDYETLLMGLTLVADKLCSLIPQVREDQEQVFQDLLTLHIQVRSRACTSSRDDRKIANTCVVTMLRAIGAGIPWDTCLAGHSAKLRITALTRLVDHLRVLLHTVWI